MILFFKRTVLLRVFCWEFHKGFHRVEGGSKVIRSGLVRTALIALLWAECRVQKCHHPPFSRNISNYPLHYTTIHFKQANAFISNIFLHLFCEVFGSFNRMNKSFLNLLLLWTSNCSWNPILYFKFESHSVINSTKNMKVSSLFRASHNSLGMAVPWVKAIALYNLILDYFSIRLSLWVCTIYYML